MSAEQIIEADLTWTGEAFESGVRICVDGAGRIERVGIDDREPTVRLTGQALLPGFVNAHSHAFQRGLRGRGERFPSGAGNFWTWREAMYELVASMTEQRAYELSRQAFLEMRAAGIATVAEFHYLRHADDERGFELDQAILAAAKEVGVRLVLLDVYYNTGDIAQPLTGGQVRFESRSLDEFWVAHDRLLTMMDPTRQLLGIAAHSIRAVPLDDLIALHEEARRRGLVMHMHVEEQRQEIERCVEHYGMRPMRLLTEHLSLDDRFTAVHCTHSDPGDLAAYLASGAHICICPLTEANLADGFADVPTWLHHDGSICFGTDSNARISMIEEARWMEYAQRLSREQRGMCVDESGRFARCLLEMATVRGAAALGIDAGRIAPGCHADFVSIDLTAPALAGFEPGTLLESLICGCDNSAIVRTCIGGQWSD